MIAAYNDSTIATSLFFIFCNFSFRSSSFISNDFFEIDFAIFSFLKFDDPLPADGLADVHTYWPIVSNIFLDFFDMIFCAPWHEMLGAALDSKAGVCCENLRWESCEVVDASLSKGEAY